MGFSAKPRCCRADEPGPGGEIDPVDVIPTDEGDIGIGDDDLFFFDPGLPEDDDGNGPAPFVF